MPAATSESARVLLVGEWPRGRSLAGRLLSRGFAVETAADMAGALRLASTQTFDVVAAAFLVEAAGSPAGLQLLRRQLPDAALLIQAEGRPAVALERMGCEVFPRAFPASRVLKEVERSAERVCLRRDNARLKELARGGAAPSGLAGGTSAMRAVVELLARFAARDGPVLLLGEDGTEKDAAARALWAASPRRDAPLVIIRPAATPLRALAVELFGQEKGAFAHAARDRRGRLELADGATAYIDDVAALDPASQEALLRLIEHGRVLRVGSTRARRADVRIIAAVSPTEKGVRHLLCEAPSGPTGKRCLTPFSAPTLRRGLLDRLSVMRITLPPLRERADDAPLIARGILRRLAGARAKPKRLGRDAERVLRDYAWPGNVRELEAVVELAARRSDAPTLRAADFAPWLATSAPAEEYGALNEAERRHVERTLWLSGGNKSRAAALLGISRRRLYHLLDRFAAGKGPLALKPAARKDESK